MRAARVKAHGRAVGRAYGSLAPNAPAVAVDAQEAVSTSKNVNCGCSPA